MADAVVQGRPYRGLADKTGRLSPSEDTYAESDVLDDNEKVREGHGNIVIEQAKFIILLEKRLATLEEKFDELKKDAGKNEDDQGDGMVPRVTRMLQHQWRLVKKKRTVIPEVGTLLVSYRGSSTTPGIDTGGRPQRLAINSKYLLEALSEITAEPIGEPSNVLVWPFKYLAVHEQKIRQAMVTAEAQYSECQSKLTGDPDPEKATAQARLATRRRDELRCVVDFMDKDMEEIFTVKSQIRERTITSIGFELLWYLFTPGDLLFSTKREGREMLQAYRVLHVTGGRLNYDPGKVYQKNNRPERAWNSESETEMRNKFLTTSASRLTPFIIDCAYVDCDGQSLGPKPKRFVIPAFPGKKNIRSLDVYPAVFDAHYEEMLQFLLERGKKVISVAGGCHQRYRGESIREAQGRRSKYWDYFEVNAQDVDSDVMVDQASGINHFQTGERRFAFQFGHSVLSAPTAAERGEVFDKLPEKAGDEWVTDIFDDSIIDVDRRSDYVSNTDLLDLRPISSQNMSDDYISLLSPRVYGYAMLSRKWLPLKAALLTDLDEDGASQSAKRTRFEDLVLPKGHKKLLQALVKHYTDKKTPDEAKTEGDYSFDVVQGKGRGLIILLHGPPGVGKTSTAECVAAELHRPLLPITCGDLQGDPKSVEKALERFCALADKWRCVLLLDEADVFLSKREKGENMRNSYVAVFLRVLEYYSGVIILTSNRVGELDEAFKSRIHVCLFYPKLEQTPSEKIWERNLARVRAYRMNIDVNEEEIRGFYRLLWTENEKRGARHWNGRQIRNAFQTAIALAHWDYSHQKSQQGQQAGEKGSRSSRPVLRAKHFNRVAETSALFEEYMGSIYGIDSQDAHSVLAAREEIRRDSIPVSYNNGYNELRSSLKGTKKVKFPGKNPLSIMDTSSTEEDSDEGLTEEPAALGDDDDIKVQQLKLELELAKLQQRRRRERGGM